MVRKLLPLAVAVVLILGCKKKPSTETGGDAPAPGGADPNATYTLKVRDEAKGDKAQVTRVEEGTTSFDGPGKKGGEKMLGKYEYTEEILDMPAGGTKPTKLTRAYKVAEKSETGPPAKPLSFVGKTVLVEKGKDGKYKATADGKALTGPEANEVLEGLNKPDGPTSADMLPQKAVKLNEVWTVGPEALKKFAASSQLPIDPAKSSMTGKLTRVYMKDGQQWGIIDMQLKAAGTVETGKGPKSELSMVADMMMDTPIDGSAHVGTKTVKGKITITSTNMGVTATVVIDVSEVETRTAVK